MRTKKAFGCVFAGLLAVVTLLAASPVGGQVIQGSGMGAGITRLDFSVYKPDVGLPGSAVQAEAAIPGENVDADIFSAAAYPPPPFSNVKIFEDELLLGYPPGTNSPDDVDGITYNYADQMPIDPGDAFTNGPYKFIQFSVDRTTIGLPGTAVFTEAFLLPTWPEAAGDVFQGQCPGIGQNVLISDEDAQGLLAPPGPSGMDDLDALEINDIPVGPMAVLYSLSEKYLVTLTNTLGPPGTAGCGADIWWFGGTTWSDHLELNLIGPLNPVGPKDDIDALFVCPWPAAPGAYAVFFSLAPGSGTLMGFNPFLPGGCDPADILRVNCLPGSRAPGLGPFIAVPAATIGLFGNGHPGDGYTEDNLDALDMSIMPYAEVPPTPTPGPSNVSSDWTMYY